jgi:hypothetical protein
MAKDLGNEQLNRWRRRAIATWASIAALVVIAFIVMFVMAATDPTENIALSRNEVLQTPSGERTWRGTFWNHSDSLYTDCDALRLKIGSCVPQRERT